MNAWTAWRSAPARAAPGFFPPEVVQIKALACELPATLGVPLSRLSIGDLVREAQRAGIVATISDKTVWRWLNEDAIRPWQHRTWIFPRDPDFAVKAGRILDLYAREWQGKRLKGDDFVISADEKTSIQARVRRHVSQPPAPSRPMRIEHEYRRGGAWAYLAALDVHRAKVFGRCERATGIQPFARLVAQVMTTSPYRDARRVFWIVDNGSSHRGEASVHRLRGIRPADRRFRPTAKRDRIAPACGGVARRGERSRVQAAGAAAGSRRKRASAWSSPQASGRSSSMRRCGKPELIFSSRSRT
jgi:hypothetical protein